MKKVLTLVIVSSMLLVSCSNNKKKTKLVSLPIKQDNYVSKEMNYSRYEGIKNDYEIFSKKGLTKPINTFGAKVDYLIPVNDNKEMGFDLFEKYNEDRVLSYYKDLSARAIGDNSFYWRWKTSLSKSKLYSNIQNLIKPIYNKNKKNVLTLKNGNWEILPIGDIGSIKNVQVAVRGTSGIITHLLVETSKAKYLICKEYNMRRIFAGERAIYGAKGGHSSYRDKPIINTATILPSAYFAFEENGDNIVVYGSGYGHGAGMPQYSAYDMAMSGYNYKTILEKYYSGAKISTIEKTLGSHDTVKVGITNAGRLEHKYLNIDSHDKVKISYGGDELILDSAKNIKVKISSGSLIIESPKGKIKTSKTVSFRTVDKDKKLFLSPLAKGYSKAPGYRGSISLVPKGSYFMIINTVDIEDYLKQVVVSEMPLSFGLEALKTQAVAARTYAISDFLKNRYASLGFHVKDTVESQVYNNQKESELANKAVEETEGEILVYKDRPMNAKYFSTTAGFTSFANDVW